MANYQNSSVTSSKLILGNYKLESAATAGGTYVNLGAGQLTGFTHTPTFYDTQAGNAPDPVEGVADEEATFDLELIEYDASVLSAISCGLLTSSSTTTLSTLNAGGATTLTPRAFRFTNTAIINGTTNQTIITVYKATLASGLALTTKSDNDTDPVNIMPLQIRAKLDSTRTAGSQLFNITKTL
jgi:hypothetical protein